MENLEHRTDEDATEQKERQQEKKKYQEQDGGRNQMEGETRNVGNDVGENARGKQDGYRSKLQGCGGDGLTGVQNMFWMGDAQRWW